MAYLPPNAGRMNVTLGGNTAGAMATVSTGTLGLHGGNNVTLSQNGNNVTISGPNALTSQSNQALSASNGSFAFQTAGFSNANGVTFGTSAGSIISASVNTSYAASNHSHGNPTLNLTNLSGTTASASNGLTLSLSAAAPGGGAAISAAGASASNGTVVFSNSNGLAFGMNGSTVTGSYTVPTQSAQTVGFYATGANTTGQSSSNTFDARSMSVSAQGGLYAGMSGNTIHLSAATTYAASNHSHGNPTLALTNLSGTTASASNGLTLSLSAAAPGAGGGVALANSETSYTSGTVNFAADGPLTVYSAANQSFRFSSPQTSSLSATGAFSISTNGGTISMGVPAFSGGISTNGNTGGTTGFATNRLMLVGGNFVTLNQSTSTDGHTLSINGPDPGLRGISAGTQLATTGTMNFANSNGVTFGMSGSSQLTASVNTTYAASNHSHGNPTLNLTNLSGTTASASNGLTLSLSAASQSAQTQNLHNLSLSGNTAGVMAQISSGTLTLAGGNNITLSQNGNAVTISGGAGGGGIALANSQTTYTSGTAQLSAAGGALTIASTTGQKFNFSVPATSSLSATGAVSLSTNGSTISIGAPVQTAQTANFYVSSNSTQLSSTAGIDLRSITFQGAGNVSVGLSQGKVLVSGAGGGGGIALRDGANSITSGTASISGVNLTASVNGQTLSLSAPATSSFVAMNGLSLSSNGATASLYMSNVLDYYQNMDRGGSAALAVPYATNGNTLMLQRLNQENNDFAGYITANTVLLNMSASATSTPAQSITGYIGIYTDNVTALSLLSSASSSWGTNAANANISSSFNGNRWFSFVSSQWNTVPQLSQGGEYVFGVFFRAAGTNMSLSYLGQQYMASGVRSGSMGAGAVSSVTLAHGNFWNAIYSTSVTAFPVTIASNAVTRTGASAAFMPHIVLNNRYAGTL